MGPRTIRQIQRWVGTAQNGVFGPTTVKALQRRVGARADGVLGARTIRALQIRINARRDGARRLNPATVAALQRYLNRH
jgi:murein L,D-transpeptidase YcbB/YkuD